MRFVHKAKLERSVLRRVAISGLAIVATAVAPRPANAQDEVIAPPGDTISTPYRWIEKGTRIGLVGGYIFTDRGDPPFGPGPSPMIGTRLRARLSSPLSLEIGFIYGNSDEYVIDPRLPGGPAVVDTVGASWLIIEASLQFALTGARTYRKIQPYFLIGGGLLQGLSTEVSDALAVPRQPFEYEIGTSGMVHIGLGAEYDISPRLGLAVEARDDLWHISTPDGWFQLSVLENILDSGAVAPDEATWTNNIELTATLYYYF
jgi:hypothetical protein